MTIQSLKPEHSGFKTDTFASTSSINIFSISKPSISQSNLSMNTLINAALAVLLTACAPSVRALEFGSQSVDGVVQIPMKKVVHPDIGPIHMPSSSFAKRAAPNDVLDPISNQRYFYLTEVDIGTPPQKLDLLLDTGSSDTWVFTAQTQQSRGRGKTTTFDQSQSSSFQSNNSNWKIEYGKGSASGTWGTDKFKIGGATVKHLSIGLANSVSQVNTGIVGVGRPQAEITFNNGGSEYLNLPLEMKAEGLINSAAYSLALDDINSVQGNIIFGGVDHDQYTGPLVEMPIVHPKHMGVTVQGIKADQRATYQLLSKPSTAILDSGTSLSYLDGDSLGAMRVAFNSNPSFALGERYYTDCNITTNLYFDFGNIDIPVPAYNFMWPVDLFVDGVTASLDFPQNSCYIGFEQSSSDENFLLFGDNVLRAMYVVYDITDNRIAVARSKASSGHPRIEAIQPGKPIPGSSSPNSG